MESLYPVIILCLLGGLAAQPETFSYKDKTLVIRNVGEFYPFKADKECARLKYSWIPIVNRESNRVIQQYMKYNGIPSAWIGLLHTFDGGFKWLAVPETPFSLSYSNWAINDDKKGYVFMEADSGTWKTVKRPEKKTVLCVEEEKVTCKASSGTEYRPYQQWKEDCNTCTCLRNGQPFCTTEDCRKTQECTSSEGKKYRTYDQWEEDCKKCACYPNGKTFCSPTKCNKSDKKKRIRCSWNSKLYKVGEKWDDGCKSCRCHKSGKAVCDDSLCRKQCIHQGKVLEIGSTFTENCRTCQCNTDGHISCQGSECAKPQGDCIHNGQGYKIGERFMDKCSICVCLGKDSVTCMEKACPKKSCTFQKVRTLPHGTQLQVECNLCVCNDGVMSCTDDRCEGVDTDGEGCSLEGEQRKYKYGSVIQMGLALCKCSLVEETSANEQILDFVCD